MSAEAPFADGPLSRCARRSAAAWHGRPAGPFPHSALPVIVVALLFASAASYTTRLLVPAFTRAHQRAAALAPAGPTGGPAHAPGSIPGKLSAQIDTWGPHISRWAQAAGLDPLLVTVVMQIESCGHPGAISPSGAMGLFQVMPFHFQPADDPFDPDTNARRGLDYLARAWRASSGEARLALAGYNGGLGLIFRPETSWPSETQRYVHWGVGMLDDLRAGVDPSPTLQRWLSSGGASLCASAAGALGERALD